MKRLVSSLRMPRLNLCHCFAYYSALHPPSFALDMWRTFK